jgi:hypothetical protein
MPSTRTWTVIALAALLAGARPASAQVGGISLWLGAGHPVKRDTIPLTLKNLDLYGAVQLDLPLLPVGFRGDVSVGSSDFKNGQRNATASVILPLRLPIVQPYGMLGYGVYDWGKSFEDRGVSYGGGVRVHVSRLGVFAQVRRHEPLKRTMGTIGMTF